MQYSFLNKINFSSDLRNFDKKILEEYLKNLEIKTIEKTKTGGHPGAGLGVIELT